ncbi:MAG: ATP/GTP-binding protein [Pseudomonadota bacterium]|nr:ATP/GTP-binding protein [Pseudomonadota bacterium]
MSEDLKIIFIGPPGAGKSTAIASISDHPPVSTDVPASDENRLTTVALDFGEMQLGEGHMLRLFGVPGQGRFEFIWPVISDGALGAIFFIDARHPAPLEILDGYLSSFDEIIKTTRSVIAVTHCDQSSFNFDMIRLSNHVRSKGLEMPATQIDARQRADVFYLLNVILESIPDITDLKSHAN